MSKIGIIGPLFFEERGGLVTVTAERYIKILRKFYKELETRFPESGSNRTEHRPTVHTALSPHNPRLAQGNIQKKGCPKHFGIECGYLKDRLNQEKPRTPSQLKIKIRKEVKAIKPEVLKARPRTQERKKIRRFSFNISFITCSCSIRIFLLGGRPEMISSHVILYNILGR